MRVTFDIGGLVIVAGKDICDFALAIIDNDSSPVKSASVPLLFCCAL